MPSVDKIIDTIELEEDRYEIWTDSGWESLTHVHKTVEFQVWEVVTPDYSIECADEHILFRENGEEVYVCDLVAGDMILTESGAQPVVSVCKVLGRDAENMYDLTVDSERHSFYSSGILSHNSTMTQIFVLWTCCFKQNQKVAILANKETTAMSIVDRIQFAYRRLPIWIKPGIETINKKSFSFDNTNNRGRIECAPTSRTGIRGISCNLLILDEAAFIDPSIVDELWGAVFPTITSAKTSKCFMVSTPNGVNNLFYDIYTKAVSEDGGWYAGTIKWDDVPGRDEAWAKEVKAGLASDDLWDQEYDIRFLDSGASSVSVKVLAKIEADAMPAVEWFDENLWPLTDKEKRKNAAFKIWELPEPGHIYSLGADVGAGVSRANSTIEVIDITDLSDIRQVAEYACNTVHSKTFKNIIVRVSNMYGVPNMLVERNNDGTGICDDLAEDRHFQNRLVNYNPLKDAEVAHLYNLPGVTNHKNTKTNMVSNARYWLNELMAVTIRSIDVKTEMETFGKKANGTWGIITNKDGVKDDRLIALYYALFLLKPDVARQYLEVWEYDQNDMPLKVSDPLCTFNHEGSIYAGVGKYGKKSRAARTYINPSVGNVKHANEEQELRDWLCAIP